jgi:hypothetical protein
LELSREDFELSRKDFVVGEEDFVAGQEFADVWETKRPKGGKTFGRENFRRENFEIGKNRVLG